MTSPVAWKLKNYSVYIGISGYVLMLITGFVEIGAVTKIIAESLRVPYFRQTDAKDMERLSYFFIASSVLFLLFYND